MSAHVVHPPTVVCNTSMRVGRDGGGVGGERCDQHRCLSYSSVEKSLHSVGGLLQLQAYNTGLVISATRFHSRPLLVSDRKAVLLISMLQLRHETMTITCSSRV